LTNTLSSDGINTSQSEMVAQSNGFMASTRWPEAGWHARWHQFQERSTDQTEAYPSLRRHTTGQLQLRSVSPAARAVVS